MDSAKPAHPNAVKSPNQVSHHDHVENKLEIPKDPNKSIEFNTVNTTIACFSSIVIYCVSLFVFNSISGTGNMSVPEPPIPQLQVEDIVESIHEIASAISIFTFCFAVIFGIWVRSSVRQTKFLSLLLCTTNFSSVINLFYRHFGSAAKLKAFDLCDEYAERLFSSSVFLICLAFMSGASFRATFRALMLNILAVWSAFWCHRTSGSVKIFPVATKIYSLLTASALISIWKKNIFSFTPSPLELPASASKSLFQFLTLCFWMNHASVWLSFFMTSISPVKKLIFISAFEIFHQLSIVAFLLVLSLTSADIDIAVENSNLKSRLSDLKKTIELEQSSNSSEGKMMRAVIANTAHDMKTPVQSVMLGSEILQGELQRLLSIEMSASSRLIDVNRCHQIASNICDACTLMSGVLHRSIKFAQDSRTSFVSQPMTCPFEFRVALQRAVAFNSIGLLDCRVVKLDDVPSEVSQWIVSDPAWLAENISCLMSNAAKHTQTGGLLRIRADLRIGSPLGGVQGTSRLARHSVPTPSDKVEMIMISVSNSGPGVPIEMFDKLFRPFQSGDVEIGGTGLGLFGIALRSESIGGKCGYDGNEFWFTFPYIAVDLAAAPESDSPPSDKIDPSLMVSDPVSLNSLLFPDTVSSMNVKFNILIVEDSTPISAMMSETLSRRGHSTKVASTGEAALELLKENWKSENETDRYDVLMLDFNLPDKSGLDVLREYFEFTGDKRPRRTLDADVKSLPLRPKDRIYSKSFQRIYGRKLGVAGRQLGDMIVIGSTGETDPHELSTGLEIGMDAIIIKPFCVVQLEHLIHIIYSLDSEQQSPQ